MVSGGDVTRNFWTIRESDESGKVVFLIHTMSQQKVYKRLTRTMIKYIRIEAPSWQTKPIYFRLESTAV